MIMNPAVHKSRYQLQNTDFLIKDIAKKLWRNCKRMNKYFFQQSVYATPKHTPNDENTAGRCNFNQATGTYRFLAGFYGLTDMPSEFQKN